MWREIAEKGVAATVQALTDSDSIRLAEQYGTHNYHPLPINIVRGEGAKVWDGDGKEYIDCVGAYSAVAHGHLNARIAETIREQLKRVTLTSRAFYNSELGLFLKGLSEYCELDVVCPMNTGAEANETAIKLARKWAYQIKGVPAENAEIIVCDGNFHGRTTTIVGFSSEAQYRDGFGPFTPGFKLIPFGDADALARAITPNTAAFLCEPIQAEAGVLVPPPGWMTEVRRICSERNVLLIWDEIQTGFARTGRKFAWMHEEAKPDMVTVGKALGGGYLPVSAAVGTKEIMQVFHPGDHGSTFGGNPLAAAVGLAAMAEMEVQDYCGLSARVGEKFSEFVRGLNHPAIEDVRGNGCLWGVEVRDFVDTQALTQAFTQNGILTKETRHRTFRFAPPIVISSTEVDEVCSRFERSLRQVVG